MYYIEVMRMWRVFWRYLIVLAGLYLLTTFLYTFLPHGASRSEGTALYSAGGHAALIAFVCLLFASVFGSSLSRHIDHLDFALTKPRTRSAFVASVLGIDALGLACSSWPRRSRSSAFISRPEWRTGSCSTLRPRSESRSPSAVCSPGMRSSKPYPAVETRQAGRLPASGSWRSSCTF